MRYKERFDNPNAPVNYKTPEGFSLGYWQSHQRQYYFKKVLSKNRIRQLNAIGFKWGEKKESLTLKIIGRSWDYWFRLTLRYMEQFDTPNAPRTYETQEGFKLGIWQRNQRIYYAKGKLREDRAKKLDKIGFRLHDHRDEAFERGILETKKYKKQFGNPNSIKRYRSPDGFNLGTWQQARRQEYAEGVLSQDKIKRLEAIGFVWNILDDRFEEGFKETLKYKEQFGDPNAPQKYRTPEGYRLGEWQSYRRAAYAKKRLSPDRVKRLEEIGFKWRRK